MEAATALGDDVLEISKSREAQMIRQMRHGSSPRPMALQPICTPNPRESQATLSAGNRTTSSVEEGSMGFSEIDWHELFVPQGPLIGVILRGTLTYLMLFLIMRFFL